MEPSFASIAVVAAVALAAPLVVGLTGLRLPSVVLEILLGVAIGPQVLGWAEVDPAVEVIALFGLAFLLLLAGLEVDLDRIRGRVLRVTGAAYAVSFGLALVARRGALRDGPRALAAPDRDRPLRHRASA